MTEEMETSYNEIVDRGATHEDFVLNLFTALKTGTNKIFKDFIIRIKDDYQWGKLNVTADELMETATTKYNSLVEFKQYDLKKTEIEEAKFLTLSTKLVEMEKKFQTLSSDSKRGNIEPGGNTGNNSGANSGKGFVTIDSWRKKNVGASLEKDGKTWYWCPKHIRENDYDGLYVKHRPENHEEWERRKRERNQSNGQAPKNGGNSNATLQLSEKLKTALATNAGFDEIQAQSFLAALNLEDLSKKEEDKLKTFLKKIHGLQSGKPFFQTEYSCARIILQMRRTLFQVLTSDRT